MDEKLKYKKTSVMAGVIILLVSHLYTLFYFPPTEGWWQAYAYMVNGGYHLYRDIDMAFPPFFVVYNAFLMRLTRYYIVYRLMGVAQVLVIFGLLYLTVRRYYDEAISLSVALFGVLMSIYNIVYFPNDYHTVVNLFVVTVLYFSVDSQKGSGKTSHRVIYALLSAIFIAPVFLLKQNIGAVLFAACVVNYAVIALKSRRVVDFVIILIYVLAAVSALISCMYAMHLDFHQLLMLTTRNDSKGSAITVLSRFMLDEGIRSILLKSAFYFIVLLGYSKVIKYIKEYYSGSEWVANVGVYIFLMLVFFRDPENTAVVLTVIYIYYLLYAAIMKREYDPLLLPFMSLIYANSMTAGLCVGGLFIVMPFALGFYYKAFLSDNKIVKGEYLYSSFVLILFVSLLVYKQKHPYNWWGLRQSEITSAKYELPYEELKFIKVDKATYTLFSDINNEIIKRSISKDDVYLYPDIPVFYHLNKKNPPTRNIVQWFDVISTEKIKKELSDIKKIDPRIVIMFEPPWEVYKGHAELKQSKLYQPEFIGYFDSMVVQGKYRMVKYQIYNNDYFGDNINEQDLVNITAIVRNPEIVGKNIDQLYDMGYFTEIYDIDDVLSRSYHVKNIESHVFLYGDKIKVKMKYGQVNEFICKVGAPDMTESKNYVLRIYERIDK